MISNQQWVNMSAGGLGICSQHGGLGCNTVLTNVTPSFRCYDIKINRYIFCEIQKAKRNDKK